MNQRKLTGLSGRVVLRALERAGFVTVRVKGSHHVLQRPGTPRAKVVVPVHGATDLPPGTVRSIVKQAGLTIEELMDLL